jgi:multidrug efflux pump subunit AcrA (membrane-fusion protein)
VKDKLVIYSPVKLDREERKANFMLLALLLAFPILLIWASFAQIDQRAKATGQIIASSRTQLIQSANDGVIFEIPVHEGQVVRRGDLLVRLEQVQAQAAVDESRGKVAALKAALTRLRAEVLGKPLVFPEEVKSFPAFIENQTELFRRRQRAVEEETRALQAQASSVKEELRLSEPLLATGDIAKTDIIRLRKQIYEIEGQITNRRNKYFQDSQADMTKAEEDLATQEQMLADRMAILERTEMRTPADGIVRNIRITTPGARLRPGDVVMEILPTDSELIIEAKLKPADFSFIRPGSRASIKLDAYDYAIYGVLQGEVVFVSPDALTEETRTGENIYYRVRIRVEEKALRPLVDGKRIELQPGMTTQVEIQTGSMSVLRYLSKPITRTVSEAFSER